MVSLTLFEIGSLRQARRRRVSERPSTGVGSRCVSSSAISGPCAPRLNVKPALMNRNYAIAGVICGKAINCGPLRQRPGLTIVLPRSFLPPTRYAARMTNMGPFPGRLIVEHLPAPPTCVAVVHAVPHTIISDLPWVTMYILHQHILGVSSPESCRGIGGWPTSCTHVIPTCTRLQPPRVPVSKSPRVQVYKSPRAQVSDHHVYGVS